MVISASLILQEVVPIATSPCSVNPMQCYERFAKPSDLRLKGGE